jgi:ABC-type transport system substrate-binding protein
LRRAFIEGKDCGYRNLPISFLFLLSSSSTPFSKEPSSTYFVLPIYSIGIRRTLFQRVIAWSFGAYPGHCSLFGVFNDKRVRAAHYG